MGKIEVAVRDLRSATGVEGGHRLADTADVPLRRHAPRQPSVQHVVQGQPFHLDQIVDGLAVARQGQAACWTRPQRDYRAIGLAGEPEVQPQLLVAEEAPARQRAEVQERIFHRLLQLVDTIIRQEDPGHMGLLRLDVLRHAGVGRRVAQETDLLGKGGNAHRASSVSCAGAVVAVPACCRTGGIAGSAPCSRAKVIGAFRGKRSRKGAACLDARQGLESRRDYCFRWRISEPQARRSTVLHEKDCEG